MAQDFSFDAVSEVDLNLVNESIQVAMKEIVNRFDFKNANASIELDANREPPPPGRPFPRVRDHNHRSQIRLRPRPGERIKDAPGHQSRQRRRPPTCRRFEHVYPGTASRS